MKHAYSFFGPKSLRTLAIVISSMTVAFVLGVETSGDVQPVVNQTRAGGAVLEGDINGNGVLDIDDAVLVLELARGDRTPQPKELAADPNQDFSFTISDAIQILKTLEHTR